MTKQQEKYATFFTKKGGKKRDRAGRGGVGRVSTLSRPHPVKKCRRDTQQTRNTLIIVISTCQDRFSKPIVKKSLSSLRAVIF